MIYHKVLVMDRMLQAHRLEEITTEVNYFEGPTTFLVGKFQNVTYRDVFRGESTYRRNHPLRKVVQD